MEILEQPTKFTSILPPRLRGHRRVRFGTGEVIEISDSMRVIVIDDNDRSVCNAGMTVPGEWVEVQVSGRRQVGLVVA